MFEHSGRGLAADLFSCVGYSWASRALIFIAKLARLGSYLFRDAFSERPQKALSNFQDALVWRRKGLPLKELLDAVLRPELFVHFEIETLGNMPEHFWDMTIAVNLTAEELIDEELAKRELMKENGRIVCISSISGIAGNFGQTNYSTAKSGVIKVIDRKSGGLVCPQSGYLLEDTDVVIFDVLGDDQKRPLSEELRKACMHGNFRARGDSPDHRSPGHLHPQADGGNRQQHGQ